MYLQLGSTGEAVRRLQEALNAFGGYGINTDGNFGAKTQSALKDWQKKMGLSANGIFDNAQYSTMYGVPSMEDLYKDTLKASEQKFSYNPNDDKLYNAYREQYIRNGNRAMQDTMGQAAQLTGGYGNTYAQSAGQQQYNDYMQQLNSMVPTLEQRAYDRWNDQRNDALNRYQFGKDYDDYLKNLYSNK